MCVGEKTGEEVEAGWNSAAKRITGELQWLLILRVRKQSQPVDARESNGRLLTGAFEPAAPRCEDLQCNTCLKVLVSERRAAAHLTRVRIGLKDKSKNVIVLNTRSAIQLQCASYFKFDMSVCVCVQV